MELRPLLRARVAHTLLGLVPAGIAVEVWQDGTVPPWLAATFAPALAFLGVLVAVRALRMGVTCRDGTARVRGLLLSRAVPRVAVTEVTDFPALRWQDATGRRRWTPLSCSGTTGGVLGSVRDHNSEQLGILRRWVRRGID